MSKGLESWKGTERGLGVGKYMGMEAAMWEAKGTVGGLRLRGRSWVAVRTDAGMGEAREGTNQKRGGR